MKDEDGDPILMLNVFVHKLKLHLASWNVQGDKTNEPGCLKKHLEELFEMYPSLKLLTGDAIYAQRPLLEALQEYHCDYLFQGRGVRIQEKGVRSFASDSFLLTPVFFFWEIENCLHGTKDKEYGEDKHVLGRNSWGEAWTIFDEHGGV